MTWALADYAQRTYFAQRRSLARHSCAIADVAVPLHAHAAQINPYMRIEAQSLHSSAMELALLSSEMQREDNRNNISHLQA